MITLIVAYAMVADAATPSSQKPLGFQRKSKSNETRPIVVSVGESIFARTGQAFALDISGRFSGDHTGEITYTATNLPYGTHLHGGVISGVPTTTGNYTVQITATDDWGEAQNGAEFDIRVNPYGTSAYNATCIPGCFGDTAGPCQYAAAGSNVCAQYENGYCSQGLIDCSLPVQLSPVSTVEAAIDLTLDLDSFLADSAQQEAMAGALAAALSAPSVVITGVTAVDTSLIQALTRTSVPCEIEFTAVVPDDATATTASVSTALQAPAFAGELGTALAATSVVADTSSLTVAAVAVQAEGGAVTVIVEAASPGSSASPAASPMASPSVSPSAANDGSLLETDDEMYTEEAHYNPVF